MNNDPGSKTESNIFFEKFREAKDAVISKGFVHLLLSNAFIFFIGFIVQLIVAYLLPPEDIGRIRFLQVFIVTGGIAASLGFNTAIQKLCSEQRPIGEKYFLLRQALKIALITSTAGYFLILGLSSFNLISNDAALNRIMPLFAVALIPQTLYSIYLAYFEALKLVKKLSVVQALTKIISLVLIVIPTIFFLFKGYIIGFTAGMIVTAFVSFIVLNREMKNVQPAAVEGAFKLQWDYARYSLLLNGVNAINLNVDIFLINYLIADRALVGQFSFAATLLVALYLITTTIQQITTPYFSERSSNTIEWRRIYYKYNKYQNLFALSAGAVSVIFGPPLISFIFHGKYDESVPFFIMLVIGWFVRNLYTLKVVALFGKGKIKQLALSFLGATIIASVVSYALVSNYGINGAGYSNIAAALITFVIVSVFFSRIQRSL